MVNSEHNVMIKVSLVPPKNATNSSTGLTWLDKSGIIIAVANEHELHTLKDAQENHAITMALSHGIRRPFLIDMTKVKSMSREARAFYAGPEPSKALNAVAIVTHSNIGKLVANFFLGLTKPQLPTRLFTNTDSAIKWLLPYVNTGAND